MSVQQFCLRWNNHQPNFISVCSSLLHNGTLVDVTLAAEGRQLQAHKIVLSACSSYFQTLFTTNPCQHPIVILKDVQYDDLKTMVDFMYYGEVNVSQEQLPHILKTAEMLKIKGLAEMPTDPANLTKSDSKSSNEPTELVGSGGGGNGQSGGGGGSSGGLGSSTGGSMSDSIWGSTGEVQFQQQQQQHHHHHQQQQQQHHQQQQSSQTQTTQHHQLRRTPSPLGAGASPATRRKRLRKSSNNGSGDRNNSEDPHNTSLDTSNATGNISLSQMGQMSFGAGTGSLSGLAGHSLHTAKLLKESTSTDVEPHPQDSDSLDDGQGHVHMQIKPEVDISGVQQTIPLDISGTTTPSEHDAPNSQSSHSDPTTSSSTGATATYPSDATVRAVNISSISASTSLQQQQQMGTKRNRVLTRQPRVKRDSDSLSNNQISPDPSTTGLDFDPFNTNATATSGGATAAAAASSSSHSAGYTPPGNTHHHHHHHHHHLLSVPPRIERHASEPAPSLTPSSPHLLSVPPSTPFLIKQHSDPLLPSQHSQHHFGGGGSIVTGGGGGGSNPFAPLHRQYSHPLPGSGSITSGSSGSSHHHVQSAPLQHISLPESIYASGSPPPAGSSQYLVPQHQQQAATAASAASSSSTGGGGGGGIDCTSEAPTVTSPHPSTALTSTSSTVNITMNTTKAHSLPQFTTTYVGSDSGAFDRGGDRSSSPLSAERSVPVTEAESHHHLHHHATAVNKFRSSKSASGVLLSDTRAGSSGSSLHPGPIAALQSSSFEHLPTLRVKNEELQRSVSSPQTSREIITLDNPRSSHCPVIRPGPALGCNFCWNTIDGHGRILRRKTKYHCPECQTNLCIVPCFQEYHERLNNEAASSTAPSNDNSKNFASSAGSGGNAARHYTKTETI